ncbi:hypothetical protein AXG93_1948s1020 [Marchantia polymorpha subsp. ruderalis]|uniref:EF-hand domain-containing protein n=1 Tax=Marchantia polymorpha subsp. ruderalis TaxID=1480154 RepID=A0A176VST1_MARPO|nr:hypothetical protein AXG93_1948s1020 [Marchantia polymorpha subsp. ruderalis]
MAAVQSSGTLSFFDSAWFFKLHKCVSSKRSGSSKSSSTAKGEEAGCGGSVKAEEEQSSAVKCDVVEGLTKDDWNCSRRSVSSACKEYSAAHEFCDKAAVSLESVKSDPEEMRRVFQRFDENTDDRICAKDLRQFMGRLGFHMSEEEAASMLASVDHNGDGSVDFDEFFSLYMSLVEQQTEDEEETLLEAFQVFDKNADGFITAQELQTVLLDLGMPEGKSLKNCEKMIRSVDADGLSKVPSSRLQTTHL